MVPEKPPLVAFLGPKNGITLSAEKSNLAGAAYDPQEGMLPWGQAEVDIESGRSIGRRSPSHSQQAGDSNLDRRHQVKTLLDVYRTPTNGEIGLRRRVHWQPLPNRKSKL